MRARSLGSVLSVLSVLAAFGCGGSSVELPEEGEDTGSGTGDGALDALGDGSSVDSGGDDGGSDTTTPPGDSTPPPGDSTPPPGDSTPPPTDSTPPPPDTGCTDPGGASATDLYVDGSVGATGTGTLACPFKTILEATKYALGSGVKRIIHVKAMSYLESDMLKVRATVRLLGEGGRAKVSGGSVAACSPSPDRCLISLDNGGSVESFDIDASSTGSGIVVAPTGSGSSALIKDTSVKNAQKDGVRVYAFTDAQNVAFNENGNDGAAVYYGTFHVIVAPSLGSSNTFDSNKGKGSGSGGSFIPGGGIVLFNNSVLVFDGGSVSNNAGHGILFDWGTSSGTIQKITGLTAKGNGGGGLTVPSGQAGLTLGRSVLTKNGLYGVWLGYNASVSNKYDLGTSTGGGGNVFGGSADKNGKVGIFLCNSGATGSQPAETDSWSVCPPTQVAVSNCDSWPTTYADIGYAQSKVAPSGPNPVPSPSSCKVGP